MSALRTVSVCGEGLFAKARQEGRRAAPTVMAPEAGSCKSLTCKRQCKYHGEAKKLGSSWDITGTAGVCLLFP